ncbi:MAG: hypothetical protein ACPL7I_10780 [Myxococcota bacterium]
MKKVIVLLVTFLMYSAVLTAEEIKESVYLKSEHNFSASLNFGLGGSETIRFTYEGKKARDEDELTITKGIAFSYSKPVTDFLMIGADGRLLFWNTESTEDFESDKMIDLSPSVRLYRRFDENFMMYIKLVAGLSVNILSDDIDESEFSYSSGLGYNLAFFSGMEFTISKDISLLLEAGYITHDVYGKMRGHGEYEGI